MGVPANANPLLLASQDTGYRISRSLRFNASDSSFLSRTPGSAGNRKTWTFSCWAKRSLLSSGNQSIFSAWQDGNNYTILQFNSSDQLFWDSRIGADTGKSSTRVFRDPSAWYHIVISCDTTQATASNRVRIYVNNQEITEWSNSNFPTQNADTYVNSTTAHYLGSAVNTVNFFGGYLADAHLIDGQQLTPSAFGEFDATTGVWVPKQFTGSYGTNGFKLDFSNPLDLGKDAAGTNNWTPNNLSGVTGGPTSVASASGALPIYNTTDTYGATKGTGTRTDANASSLVLALPMDGANNGTTFTDESATIKGSGSAKAITRYGDTKTVTSVSKYYGSSGFFDGTGDYLGIPANSDFDLSAGGNFTIECWVNPSTNGAWNTIAGYWGQVNSTTDGWILSIQNGVPSLHWQPFNNQGTPLISSGTVSAGTWTHLAVTKNGTSFALYINGLLRATATNSGTNSASTELKIGTYGLSSNNFQGYIQDLRIYKGVAKYTGNFNPPSSTQNATVAAGNDSLVDVPVNGSQTDTGAGGEVRGNYATFNNLLNTSGSYANGNLERTQSDNFGAISTICPSSGKWYAEFTYTAIGSAAAGVIVTNLLSASGANGLTQSWQLGYTSTGKLETAGSQSNVTGFTTNDVIGVAFDCATGAATFYKNGSSIGTATSTAFANVPVGIGSATGGAVGSNTVVANFGQRPFAYTAPSGFKALCTANLPAPLVTKPSDVFDVKLYTGNGSTQSITGLGFSPDLVWLKRRSSAQAHYWYDAIRGTSSVLYSDGTDAEQSISTGLTAFNSDGFSLGSLAGVNASSSTYAAWAWDAGSTTVTDNTGTIQSSRRTNASAGFSIVTYTGNGGSNVSVGHGLGVAPVLLICKSRSASADWDVTYTFGDGSYDFMSLNSTAAKADITGRTAPTSTLFYVNGGLSNVNGTTYVCYAFAPVNSYSAFGSYQGNGSSDGPFVYTGHRSRFLLIKCSSLGGSGQNWIIIDTSRDTYNISENILRPNLSDAEIDYGFVDVLSNGFKLKNTDNAVNGSGQTYIYMALAESPFQYARAR